MKYFFAEWKFFDKLLKKKKTINLLEKKENSILSFEHLLLPLHFTSKLSFNVTEVILSTKRNDPMRLSKVQNNRSPRRAAANVTKG